jgi:MFS family permease
MAATTTAPAAAMNAEPAERRNPLASPWAIGGLALLLLLILGWKFLADPSLSAPTRDPAWYTWRANVIMESDPGSVAGEWGPDGLFSGGYRITVPLAGAMLQQVAGIDTYSFSAFLMLGMPILTGMALGAGAYRSRRDPLVMLMTMLAAVALFLTTPYVGYLDNITVLFLLALTFPFLHASKTSWGARVALFLIGVAAAFTHPTTCVLFGLTLLAVFGWHFLTSRFSFGAALRSDAPMLFSVGLGMIVGLAAWVIGIWGTTAKISDAALPPPYTKRFFLARLWEWVLSLQPIVIVPFLVVALASTILLARRAKQPANQYDVAALWWMFPFIGVFTFFTGADFETPLTNAAIVPYYRFMNASAAPMALAGLGSFALIAWFWAKGEGPARLAAIGGAALALVGLLGFVAGGSLTEDLPWYLLGGVILLGALVLMRALVSGLGAGAVKAVAALATVLVVGSLGWVLFDGVQNRWVSEENQWANQGVRSSLAAVHEVVTDAEARPIVLVMNYDDTADPADRTNTAYGWAKTYTNVFRTGLPGDEAKYQVTYLGTVENYLAGVATEGESDGYNDASEKHFGEVERRLEEYPEDPVVFVIGQYYKGLCNGVDDCSPETEQQNLDAALAGSVEVGPDTFVLEGDGLYAPPAEVVDRAEAAATEAAEKFANHPPAWGDPLGTLLVLLGLVVLLVLPGWLAAPFFETNSDWPSRMALIPGMSVVLSLLSGIAVLTVWRGPLTTTKGWVAAGLAVGIGALLRYARKPILKPLEATGNFFNSMFSVFSVKDFAVLMGVQFLIQAADGVIRGAIGKSIAFGGTEGFDITNVPSPAYLLEVVLALYLPYTLVSPFIGVFIDRFPRRRVVSVAAVAIAAAVSAVAVLVLLPLGGDSSEGKAGVTTALIIGLLLSQAVVRIALAVKSASLPDVVSGKDLLQANGLSQAGGAVFQIFGIAFAFGATAFLPAWLVVILGAAVLVLAAIVAGRLRHMQAHRHETSFAQEAGRVLKDVWAGLKEVAGRPAAAIGLSGFQMLRFHVYGFVLMVFALYARSIVTGGADAADNLALALGGLGGLAGGALGMIVAQKYKDRVAPIKLLLGFMAMLGVATVVFGAWASLPAFAGLLFFGLFGYFVAKIAADTITQQAMPDDFRGRAFALFDIAYNLGFIVPALILYFVWNDARVRALLVVSGLFFLAVTALLARWASRRREEFAPQDDLIGEEAEEVAHLPADD